MTENETASIPTFYQDIPLVIDITLYKNNYYDNKIISLIKRRTRYMLMNGNPNHIVISVIAFKELLKQHFSSEIISALNVPLGELSKKANSPYFIDRIMDNYPNLQFIRIHVSNSRSFTRIQTNQTGKILSFQYKIINAVIDFSNYLETKEEFDILNDLLIELGIVKPNPLTGKPNSYIRISAQDLINGIKFKEPSPEEIATEDPIIEIEDSEFFDKYDEILDLIYLLIDLKVEEDNSTLLLITDYVD